jgi:hypothetical protein
MPSSIHLRSAEGMGRMPMLLSVALAVSAALSLFADVPEPDPTVAALDASFTEQYETAGQPLRDLRAKYFEKVEEWMLQSQKNGDLEAVIAAKEEIKTVDLEEERHLTKWPGLQRLRNIYDSSMEKLMIDVNAERTRLQGPYREALQREVERLTREGKIEEAKRVAEKMTEFDRAVSQEAANSGKVPEVGAGEILWEFAGRASVESVKDAEVKTVSGGHVITSARNDWSYFQSKRKFKAPFRLQCRVSTDKNEIRFYYNADILSIFGWDSNPTELRLHEPATGRKLAFQDKGQVVPGKIHFIEIDVHLDRIEVRVDGEERALAMVSSAGVEAPVGIGPAFGSVVTVEMMRVLELKPD